MFLRNALAVFLVLIGSASAQTPGNFIDGQVLGAPQLNTDLGGKADAANGVLTTPTLNGATINSPVFGGLPVVSTSAVTIATGTNQASAAQITGQQTFLTTVAAGTGVVLNSRLNGPQAIYNRGANSLLVYPFSGAQIETASVNNPVTILVGMSAVFRCPLVTQCYAGW